MDTIILKIYGIENFRVQDKSLWVPELTKRRTYDDLTRTERLSTYHYLKHFKLRPKHEQQYMPSVDLFENLAKDRKAVQYVLMITFSVPKLLYGNSLQEVADTDKPRVIRALQSALEGADVHVGATTLENARIAAVHTCKNILLPPTIRMQEILDELMRVDISKVIDVTGTQHKKGGRVLNIFGGTIDRTFYEKVSDAMRPKNKRKDKWIIKEERAFIERYGLQNREIFRYEYRLKKMATVEREVNAALGRVPKTRVVFGDLFTADLCKKLLIKSWRDLLQRPENQLALLRSANDLLLLPHVLAEAKRMGNSAYTLNAGLTSYGLARAIRDHGAKEVRRMVFGLWNTDHPERLTHKMRLAAQFTRDLPYSDCITYIDAQLEKYALITIDFLEKEVKYKR